MIWWFGGLVSWWEGGGRGERRGAGLGGLVLEGTALLGGRTGGGAERGRRERALGAGSGDVAGRGNLPILPERSLP